MTPPSKSNFYCPPLLPIGSLGRYVSHVFLQKPRRLSLRLLWRSRMEFITKLVEWLLLGLYSYPWTDKLRICQDIFSNRKVMIVYVDHLSDVFGSVSDQNTVMVLKFRRISVQWHVYWSALFFFILSRLNINEMHSLPTIPSEYSFSKKYLYKIMQFKYKQHRLVVIHFISNRTMRYSC